MGIWQDFSQVEVKYFCNLHLNVTFCHLIIVVLIVYFYSDTETVELAFD